MAAGVAEVGLTLAVAVAEVQCTSAAVARASAAAQAGSMALKRASGTPELADLAPEISPGAAGNLRRADFAATATVEGVVAAADLALLRG